jgi:hypothetical protein
MDVSVAARQIGPMLKLKHVLHPVRTAKSAQARFADYLDRRRFVQNSERHFRGDARYDLESVRRGFAPRPDTRCDDHELLKRISAAYIKSTAALESKPDVYRATDWWRVGEEGKLAPVMRALKTGDVAALSGMYRNFFRDPCSYGLVEEPYGAAALRAGKANGLAGRRYLCDTLYRIDHWKAQTRGRFSIPDLAAPSIGNPFGVDFDGALVTPGAPYHHYCAQRIIAELGFGQGAVAEVGGGFGGMAYYLLKDQPKLKYLDFDVPVSIALSTYYLGMAYPELRFLLYGEGEIAPETIAAADVVLMPAFEMEKVASASVGMVFSSHAMSDMSPAAMIRYLETIGRITRGCFFYVGNREGAAEIAHIVSGRLNGFRLQETRSSNWRGHTHPMKQETECLYRVQ